MGGLESLSGFVAGLLGILAVVNAIREYLGSVKRAGRKDLPRQVRSRRAALLVLHTIVLVVALAYLWLLGAGGVPVDNSLHPLLIVAYALAFLYVVLSVGTAKDDYEARSEEIKGELKELDERLAEELLDGFRQKIKEGADQEELQKHLSKEERRMKRAWNKLLRRLAGE